MDTKNIKHETVAKELRIKRQAFSQRTKCGNFQDEAKEVIAKTFGMSKEALEDVDPFLTKAAFNGQVNHQKGNVIVFNFVAKGNCFGDVVLHAPRNISILQGSKLDMLFGTGTLCKTVYDVELVVDQ